jgi:hypothetical protein
VCVCGCFALRISPVLHRHCENQGCDVWQVIHDIPPWIISVSPVRNAGRRARHSVADDVHPVTRPHCFEKAPLKTKLRGLQDC